MPLTMITSKTTGWLLVVLLVITFALGALLTLTIQDRNLVKQTLKETKQELKQEKAESQRQEGNFNGCLGALGQINQAIAKNAADAQQSNVEARALATSSMAQLPKLIRQDRTLAAQPATATQWVKGLFR